MQPTRRTLAKGAAWSIPAIAVATPAPALAASPCASITKGTALPASVFSAYFIVTNQSNGGLINKVDVFAAGIWIDPNSTAASCIKTALGTSTLPAVSSFALNTTNSGTMVLTNGTSYSVYGGSGIAGTGTLGTTDSGCSGPSGAVADSCNTYTGNSLRNSTGTSSYNPKSAVLYYTLTVAGFGTTNLTLTVPSFKLDGTNWDGVGVTVS